MSQFSNAMESFWDNIIDMLEEAWDWSKPILKATLRQLVIGGGATLISAAENAVQAAQASGGSGNDKYEMAFAAVKQTIKDSGQDVIDSSINLAIEMAVAKLKSELE